MRLLRGASPTSWDGLKEWNPPFFRPLLHVDRSDIEAYANKAGITWRDDQSNFGTDYARNLLRNVLVPELDGLFPGWEANVERLPVYGQAFGEAVDLALGDAEGELPLARLAGRSE